MSIIISRDGKNAKKLESTVIQQEDYLQKYIEDNADCLPLHDLKDNCRLLILAREFPTPRGGYIDLLAVDADGDIYIIETKLAKNADKRRIIAQALDYGAAIWGNPSELLTLAENTEWRTKLLVHLGGDESAVAGCIASFEVNARAGQFRFVVLMDHLDDGLRELISFVNQNSQFKVLGVELEFYSHEGFEIVIPKLYGAESATGPGIAASAGTTPKRKWDEASIFAATAELLSAEDSVTMRELYDRCKSMGGDISVTGKSLSVTFKVSKKPVFSLSADRNLELQFDPLLNCGSDSAACAVKLRTLLEQARFLKSSDREKYPRISFSLIGPRVDEFMQILRQSLDSLSPSCPS